MKSSFFVSEMRGCPIRLPHSRVEELGYFVVLIVEAAPPDGILLADYHRKMTLNHGSRKDCYILLALVGIGFDYSEERRTAAGAVWSGQNQLRRR